MNWKKYEEKLLKNKRFRMVATRPEPEYQLTRNLIVAKVKKAITWS